MHSKNSKEPHVSIDSSTTTRFLVPAFPLSLACFVAVEGLSAVMNNAKHSRTGTSILSRYFLNHSVGYFDFKDFKGSRRPAGGRTTWPSTRRHPFRPGVRASKLGFPQARIAFPRLRKAKRSRLYFRVHCYREFVVSCARGVQRIELVVCSRKARWVRIHRPSPPHPTQSTELPGMPRGETFEGVSSAGSAGKL